MQSKIKIKVFKNDSSVLMQPCFIGWEVIARNSSGNVIDKIRCDDYRMALEYYRAFYQLAKNN